VSSAERRAGGSQPRRLCEFDTEPVASALGAPGHLRARVSELKSFFQVGATGQAGAQLDHYTDRQYLNPAIDVGRVVLAVSKADDL
jgi:hypothetical protein